MTLHDYVHLQMEEINRHKWIESQKVGYDLGDNAVYDWVDRYAAQFRRHIQETMGEQIEYPNGKIAPPMDPGATIRCSFSCKRIA